MQQDLGVDVENTPFCLGTSFTEIMRKKASIKSHVSENSREVAPRYIEPECDDDEGGKKVGMIYFQGCDLWIPTFDHEGFVYLDLCDT